MQHIQLWMPNNCDCIVHQLWEDDPNTGERVFVGYVTEAEAEEVNSDRRKAGVPTTSIRVPSSFTCQHHQSLHGTPDLHDALIKECSIVADCIRAIQAKMPEIQDTVLDPITGEVMGSGFKTNYQPIFTFNPDRSLNVHIVGYDEANNPDHADVFILISSSPESSKADITVTTRKHLKDNSPSIVELKGSL